MYTTHMFHSNRKQKMGLKWASQLITQIWKLIYFQCLRRSKLKQSGEALNDNTKELIPDEEITYEHRQGKDKLTYQ